MHNDSNVQGALCPVLEAPDCVSRRQRAQAHDEKEVCLRLWHFPGEEVVDSLLMSDKSKLEQLEREVQSIRDAVSVPASGPALHVNVGTEFPASISPHMPSPKNSYSIFPGDSARGSASLPTEIPTPSQTTAYTTPTASYSAKRPSEPRALGSRVFSGESIDIYFDKCVIVHLSTWGFPPVLGCRGDADQGGWVVVTDTLSTSTHISQSSARGIQITPTPTARSYSGPLSPLRAADTKGTRGPWSSSSRTSQGRSGPLSQSPRSAPSASTPSSCFAPGRCLPSGFLATPHPPISASP